MTIVLRTVSDVLTVPVSAITKVTSTTATVKVLDAGTTATPQTVTVTTGALGGGLVQIVEGLTEGQRVVLADRQQALPAGNVFGRRTSASASPVAGGAAPATAPGGSSSSTAAPTGSRPHRSRPSRAPARPADPLPLTLRAHFAAETRLCCRSFGSKVEVRQQR
ncbi:MAG: hypothetical protein HZY73_14375 [Micropruina sp.]|nr:MAG: hypothetical protein HZY73_14375 [Micropruina sp.]